MNTFTDLKKGWGGHQVAAPIHISPQAQQGLDDMLHQLRTGQIGLWHLPFEIRAFYWAGFADAEVTYKTQLEQLQHEADMFYELWMNPGKKLSQMKQRRIDQAMDAAWNEGKVFTEAEQIVAMVQAAMPRREAA